MARRRGWEQFKAESLACDDLADRAHKMTVECKMPAGIGLLQFLDCLVELADRSRQFHSFTRFHVASACTGFEILSSDLQWSSGNRRRRINYFDPISSKRPTKAYGEP